MKRTQEWRDFDATATSSTWRIAVAVLVVIAMCAGVWLITVAWAPWKGAGEQRRIVQGDGNYRIAAYERFYDSCAAIQAVEDQIAAAQADTSLPEQMRATNVLALTNRRNTLIRQYNADARKTDTVANFLASDLPAVIDPESETTTCTS